VNWSHINQDILFLCCRWWGGCIWTWEEISGELKFCWISKSYI